MKRVITLCISLSILGISIGTSQTTNAPNILIILSDDQGWGDVGFNGCTDIPTPNLDQLAKDGVVFSQGYASHPYCSPSRAGLLSGRYQYRFGHENNIPYENPSEDAGLPLDELLLSELLQQHDYQTSAIGKWHLGDHPKFWPNQRGFDDWYGFFGGGLNYWGDTGKKTAEHGVLRNEELVPKGELSYLTDDFSREAISYIKSYSQSNRPFFMYLAYNAPHAPIQATATYLDQVSHIEDGARAAYAAMVVGMDHGIGQVIQQLKESGEYENTLIIFYSDNGGHLSGASNQPFRGHKGMLFEGGIRVPFIISWPKAIQGGRTYDQPISALDIYPTVLAGAKIDPPSTKPLDGVNLLPFLNGANQETPHETLIWRYSDGAGYAVRQGNLKLIKSAYKDAFLLFDLDNDPYEHHNIGSQFPNKVTQLKQIYTEWAKGTVKGKWQDPHLENVVKEEKKRQWFIDKAMNGARNKKGKEQP